MVSVCYIPTAFTTGISSATDYLYFLSPNQDTTVNAATVSVFTHFLKFAIAIVEHPNFLKSIRRMGSPKFD